MSRIVTSRGKWKRAPEKELCRHEQAEPLKKVVRTEGNPPEERVAQRLGFTMMWCEVCDSSWWEPNDNLESLGIL